MAASAQQPERVRRVGVLMAFAETDMEVQARVAAFRQELRKSGWLEGANLRIDERWATDTMEHVHAYKLNFNFLRDIAPVASIISLPLVMVVNPSVSAKTVPAKRLASLSLDTTRHTCRVSE